VGGALGTPGFDPEQTSAACRISMSRTQQLFDVQTGGQFKQLGEGAKEVRVL